MFNARWVDEQHKGKSRYVVKDFANTRDPTMFAAASDKAVGRVLSTRRCFKTTACAYTMPGRTNLSFWNRHWKRSKSVVIVCGGR